MDSHRISCTFSLETLVLTKASFDNILLQLQINVEGLEHRYQKLNDTWSFHLYDEAHLTVLIIG